MSSDRKSAGTPLLWGIVALAAVALGGCGHRRYVDNSPVLARAGGEAITQTALDQYLADRPSPVPAPPGSSPTKRALTEMVNTALLAERARKEGLDRSPALHYQLVENTDMLLAKAAVARYLDTHPITAAALNQAYQAAYQDGGVVEYRARHILVPSRREAKALIAKLAHGASFAALARRESRDRLSADNGGELGWFTAGQMLPAFVAGIAGLKPGEISPVPVRTEFGWHVVELEGRRVLPAPPLAQTRSALVRQLQAAEINSLMANLRLRAGFH